MLLYNVTTHVNHSIREQWLAWMKEKHIPEVMSKNCFTEYRFARVLEMDEADGATYTIQYFAANKDQYDRYIELFADGLRKDIAKMWGNNTTSFRSLMELVN